MTPERMTEMYHLVFEGLKRAVRQLSLEHLDWVAPERPRSMRQLLWHSFERPKLSIEAWESGHFTEEMVRRYEELANNYRTQEDICRYADQIEAELTEFLRRGDRLRKEVETYMGPLTVHELIELALGHAVQHLRHAYHYFPKLGIVPDQPLEPKDYADVAIPKDLF